MTIQVEEIRLNLPHLEMAAHLYGPEDGHPVIALHGWLDNAATFTRLAPMLPGLRILALDFAGHGYSAHRPPGGSYLIWDNVLDVLLARCSDTRWAQLSLCCWPRPCRSG
jgi:pimeloyl-ACP methyl ester carboxylesterase